MAQVHRLLIITHNLGGGVERYVSDLQVLFSGAIQTEILRPFNSKTVSLDVEGREPVFWSFEDWLCVVEVLRARGYSWISVQHIDGFPSQILTLPAALALPYDVAVHDFYPFCPIYSLSTLTGEYCGEPDLSDCERCISGRPNAWKWSVERWRTEMQLLLAGAARITAPSRFVADRLHRHFPETEPVIWAHPPRNEWILPTQPVKKILLLGKLTHMKGLDRLLACAQRVRNEKLGLAFCVLGFPEEAIQPSENLPIQIRGEYTDANLPQLLALERADVVWFPGPYPETYCYTLDAAMNAGLPIVASEFGAIAERLQGYSGAVLLAHDSNPQAWCDALLVAASLPRQPIPQHVNTRTQSARDEYKQKFIAPIFAQLQKTPLAHGELTAPAGITLLPYHPLLGELSLIHLFETGVECGHIESRAALKNKLVEVERDFAVLNGYTNRTGVPWFELLNNMEMQTAILAKLNITTAQLESHQMSSGDEVSALKNQASEQHMQIAELTLQIDERNAHLNHSTYEIQRYAAELTRLVARVNELEGSKSWRITAPLRAIRQLVTQLKYRALRLTSVAMHALGRMPLALKILKSDGLTALLQRLQSKLGARQFSPSAEWSAVLAPIGKLLVPTCAAEKQPLISIVIPVYGQHEHTFNCLSSIVAHTKLDGVEVIVVDDASIVPAVQGLSGVSGVTFLRAAKNGGFIESCRIGAEHARGQFLILLNNDVQVTSGWLDSLLAVFQLRTDAGLVGARLIYPNGRLQEAGGIVWQDGSAWNWGRDQNPDHPQHRYLRAVDYCSGACLAIKMADWKSLGGFDKLYSPAYYEDTDLAFRVRQQLGKMVYYQPEATIIHFEGISSGTDESFGIKRNQAINRTKFFARWESVLKSHHCNGHKPEREADRGANKRILVVEACMITPDQDSGSVRMLAMLELLVELGCKVSLIADNIEYRQPYVGQLQQIGVEVWHHPFVESVAQLLTQRGKDYDVIIFCRHYIAVRYITQVRSWAPQAKIVFDTVDLHYLREQRLAELDGSKSLHESAQTTREQELSVIAQSDLTLVVSPIEKDLLALERPLSTVEILSNIHEVRSQGPAYVSRTGLIFVGGFRHPPNVDAVIWFVERVWPLVQKALPDITLTIVGSNMPSAVRDILASNVFSAGFVEHLEPLLDSARISIAPLRYGAGVKGKINQAMACGLPVIATVPAAEGMALQDGEDLLIADTPEAFAAAVIRLYHDENLWNRLAQGGRRNIQSHFSRAVAKRALTKVLGLELALENVSEVSN